MYTHDIYIYRYDIPVLDSGDNMISPKIAISSLIRGTVSGHKTMWSASCIGRPDDPIQRKNMFCLPSSFGRGDSWFRIALQFFMTSGRVINYWMVFSTKHRHSNHSNTYSHTLYVYIYILYIDYIYTIYIYTYQVLNGLTHSNSPRPAQGWPPTPWILSRHELRRWVPPWICWDPIGPKLWLICHIWHCWLG